MYQQPAQPDAVVAPADQVNAPELGGADLADTAESIEQTFDEVDPGAPPPFEPGSMRGGWDVEPGHVRSFRNDVDDVMERVRALAERANRLSGRKPKLGYNPVGLALSAKFTDMAGDVGLFGKLQAVIGQLREFADAANQTALEYEEAERRAEDGLGGADDGLIDLPGPGAPGAPGTEEPGGPGGPGSGGPTVEPPDGELDEDGELDGEEPADGELDGEAPEPAEPGDPDLEAPEDAAPGPDAPETDTPEDPTGPDQPDAEAPEAEAPGQDTPDSNAPDTEPPAAEAPDQDGSAGGPADQPTGDQPADQAPGWNDVGTEQPAGQPSGGADQGIQWPTGEASTSPTGPQWPTQDVGSTR